MRGASRPWCRSLLAVGGPVRGCAELAERLRSRLSVWQRDSPDTAPAAIDLWDTDTLELRRQGHDAVRAALREGARPRRLGLAFVAVIADLAYEVDWGDQFSFWPLLNDRLDALPFDLGDGARRNECAHAFRTCAQQFGLIVPEGAFSQSFPLMSLPLFHAVLPKSAHRRVAELLGEASAGADLVQLARSRNAPKYLVGLLEHSGLRRRLERLVADDELDVGVLRRIRADIEADDNARRALQLARKLRGGLQSRGPRLLKLLVQPGPPAKLYLAFGPIDDAEAKSDALARVASDFGAVSFVTAAADGPVTEPEYLVNARGRPILVPLRLHTAGAIDLRPRISPRSSTDVDEAEACLGPPLVLSVPMVFRQAHTGAFVHLRDRRARRGDILAVVSSQASPLVPHGFGEPVEIEGTQWVVSSGPCEAISAAALGLSITNHTRLQSAFIPARSIAADVYEYVSGDAPIFWIDGIDSAARFILRRREHTQQLLPIRVRDMALIQLQASELVEPADLVALSGSDEELSCVKVSVVPTEMEVEPWAARLCPEGAALSHLSERICWVDGWTLEGVPLCVRLDSGLGHHVEAQLTEAQYADRDAAVSAFSALARRLEELGGNLPVTGPVRVLAWPEGHPSRARVIGELRDQPEAIAILFNDDEARFEVPHAEPANIRLHHVALDQSLEEREVSEHLLSCRSREGLYIIRYGPDTRAIVWAGSGAPEGLPPLPLVAERSLQRAEQLTSRLRVLDGAALGPPRAVSGAEELRRALIVRHERELVRVLCGAAWLQEEAATVGAVRRQAIERLAPFTDFDLRSVGELSSNLEAFRPTEDPLPTTVGRVLRHGLGARKLLDLFLEDTANDVDLGEDRARHLLLLFRRRAAAPASADLKALSWAYRLPRAARFVRLIDLITKRVAGEEDQ